MNSDDSKDTDHSPGLEGDSSSENLGTAAVVVILIALTVVAGVLLTG